MNKSAIRGGRPRAGDPETLRIALISFIDDRGFDQITMAQLADHVGISVRTLHRYFPSKADIVWGGIPAPAEALRENLQAAPPELSVVEAITRGVVATFNRSQDEQVFIRQRLRLIVLSPALRGARAEIYADWRAEFVHFIAHRRGEQPTDLIPVALGAGVHAVIIDALGWWANQGENRSPTSCIEEALLALSSVTRNS